MRSLPIVLLATALAACATPAPADASRTVSAPASTPAALPIAASPIDFLLDSAASDFRAHPPTPSGFRNVRYGQLIAEDGTVSHRLCGEFQVQKTDSEPEWKAFATLKTSGYEQWLGDTAYCSDKVQWTPGDLSAELQRRFDATR
jgi:hypothetical protein